MYFFRCKIKRFAFARRTLFTMNLMNVKPDRGFYKISITAAAVTNTITVKVLSEALLDYLEIGTGDADQTTQPKLTRYLATLILFAI